MTDMTWGHEPATQKSAHRDSAYRHSVYHDFACPEPRAVRRGVPQWATCAIALLFSAPIGFAMLNARPVTAPQASAPQVAAALPSPAPHAAPAASVPLRHYAALLDPAMIAGTKPAAFAKPAPLRAAFEPKATALPPEDAADETGVAPAPAARLPVDVAALEPADAPAETQVVPALPPMPALVKEVPLPVARPDFAIPATMPHVAARQLASAMPERPAVSVAVAPAPVPPGAAPPAASGADENSFFNKLFSPLTKPGSALGYAAVEAGAIGVPGAVDRYTAVYDITAHTVTLPNGAKLEAHSGLGAYVDNPAGVNLRMRGATPPNLYELSPREAIFHGVRALRMTPTGGTTYGRAGLLTHNYMLRGRVGESNGCVVFANYPAFLAAYESGQVRRLLVVARAS